MGFFADWLRALCRLEISVICDTNIFLKSVVLSLDFVDGFLCLIKILHFYIVKYVQLFFMSSGFLGLIKVDVLLNRTVVLLDFSSKWFSWFIFYI